MRRCMVARSSYGVLLPAVTIGGHDNRPRSRFVRGDHAVPRQRLVGRPRRRAASGAGGPAGDCVTATVRGDNRRQPGGGDGTSVERSGVTRGLDAVADSAHLSIIASSRGCDWHGIHAEEVSHRAEEFGLPSIPDHLFVFHLDRPLLIEERLAGRSGRLREGSLTILPAGAETRW